MRLIILIALAAASAYSLRTYHDAIYVLFPYAYPALLAFMWLAGSYLNMKAITTHENTGSDVSYYLTLLFSLVAWTGAIGLGWEVLIYIFPTAVDPMALFDNPMFYNSY